MRCQMLETLMRIQRWEEVVLLTDTVLTFKTHLALSECCSSRMLSRQFKAKVE
jgi:hypothetical protein